MLNFEMRVQN